MAESPNILDVLTAHAAASQPRGPQPGLVRSYDAAAFEVDVDLLVLPPEGAPVLRQVPVLWPCGIEGTLAAGDLVLLVVCERDLTAWARARTQRALAPSQRRSALSDCVALPMWSPASSEAVALASGVSDLIGRINAWALTVQTACGAPLPDFTGLVLGGSINVRP